MELPKRKSNRLKGYNYNQNGAYFITICTHEKEKTLSEICNGNNTLLPIGLICKEYIDKIINIENSEMKNMLLCQIMFTY